MNNQELRHAQKHKLSKIVVGYNDWGASTGIIQKVNPDWTYDIEIADEQMLYNVPEEQVEVCHICSKKDINAGDAIKATRWIEDKMGEMSEKYDRHVAARKEKRKRAKARGPLNNFIYWAKKRASGRGGGRRRTRRQRKVRRRRRTRRRRRGRKRARR